MKLIYNNVFLEHDTSLHPENKKRLEGFESEEKEITAEGKDYIHLVHDNAYTDFLRRACAQSLRIDPDTVTSPGSFNAAIQAVGATMMAARQGDFALVRPPGHHAYPDHASGFCLFNNIAIATQQLVNEGKRVLIFDFDGHYGDGTSHIFYNSDQVFYWSLHQYPAFPGNGFVDEIGEGPGKGFTMNVALPPGSGDDIFMNAVEHFFPAAIQFQPDVVAVSAGFDAHALDLLLDLEVTSGSFYKIGRMLGENFPTIFASLEGGYNIEELHNGVYNFLAGINKGKEPFPEREKTSRMQVWQEYEARIHSLTGLLSPWWKF